MLLNLTLYKVSCFEKSWHGPTLVSLSCSYNEMKRQQGLQSAEVSNNLFVCSTDIGQRHYCVRNKITGIFVMEWCSVAGTGGLSDVLDLLMVTMTTVTMTTTCCMFLSTSPNRQSLSRHYTTRCKNRHDDIALGVFQYDDCFFMATAL